MDATTQIRIDNGTEFAATLDQVHKEQIEGRLRDLHTGMPGIVISFDPVKQTAQVQPAIKRIWTGLGAVNLPMCVDVPANFCGGGGLTLTFPVKAGDECWLAFSERAIDFWYQNGGIQLPSEYRIHDLSDAVAFVGLNSQPNKLANLCMTGAELRTRDGSTFVRVEPGMITIQGNVVVHGSIAVDDDVTAEGTSLHTHKHTGVQPGSGVSGVPQ